MNSILRKAILGAIVAIAAVPAINAATEKAATPATRLGDRLKSLVGEHKTLFGHHDDTSYGHDWTGVKYAPGTFGKSDVKDVTGYYPGAMSWDLGGLELNDTVNLDGVPFELIRRNVREQDARGGVNVFSWHTVNPVNGANSWDVSDKTIVHKIHTMKQYQDKYRESVRKVARYIKSLTDKDGRRIGVVFRPWHEQSGGWFWWGLPNCNAEDYKYLWTEMRKVFDQEGVDNVLWAFSPDRIKTEAQFLESYPGDEYVDVVGTDVYEFAGEGGDATYLTDADDALRMVTEMARKRNKIPAFTETGLEGLPVADWFTARLLPLLRKYPVAYVVVWRNAEDNKKHFFAPFPGHPAADDFKTFVEDPMIVMCGKPASCCGNCAK